MHSGVLLHLKAINFAENQPLEDGRKAARQLGTLRAVGLRQLDVCWNGAVVFLAGITKGERHLRG